MKGMIPIGGPFLDYVLSALAERELGGGGMNHVFVARDEALGREIVVKVLRPDAAAALSADRFKREIAHLRGAAHRPAFIGRGFREARGSPCSAPAPPTRSDPVGG